MSFCWIDVDMKRCVGFCPLCQVPENEKYNLGAMSVPVVMVALEGGLGGHVIEQETEREIQACEGGVFFLPAYTPVVVCSGSTAGIRMALAHTNLHWGALAAPTPNSPRRSKEASRAPAFA